MSLAHGQCSAISLPSFSVNAYQFNQSFLKPNSKNNFLSPSFIHEQNNRMNQFFLKISKNFKKDDLDSLTTLLKYTISTSSQSKITEKISTAFFKKEGYFKRFFSNESWNDWTENRTSLGKIAFRFKDCITSSLRVDKFTKFQKKELLKANDQAKLLLQKLKDNKSCSNSKDLHPTSDIFSSIYSKIASMKALHAPILNSALIASSFALASNHPDIMIPLFFANILTSIQKSSAQILCPSGITTFDLGTINNYVTIDGHIVSVSSNSAGSNIRILDVTDPNNVAQITSITGFPYAGCGNALGPIAMSKDRLVAVAPQACGISLMSIIELNCTEPTSSSLPITTSTTSTSSSSITSSTSSISSTTTTFTTTSSTQSSTSTCLCSQTSTQGSSSLPSSSYSSTSLSSTSSSSNIPSSSSSTNSIYITSSNSKTTFEIPPTDSNNFKYLVYGILIGLSSNAILTMPLYVYLFLKSKKKNAPKTNTQIELKAPIEGVIFTERTRAALVEESEETTEIVDPEDSDSAGENKGKKESPYQRTPDFV